MSIIATPAVRTYPGFLPGGFEVIYTKGDMNLVANAYYDAVTGNWYRKDETKSATRIYLQSNYAYVDMYYASPGTGVIIWGAGFDLHYRDLYITKIHLINTFAQDTEPNVGSGEVALWHDNTAGAEHWWFIWDDGGVQHKVELT